jgi:hypothetical protein
MTLNSIYKKIRRLLKPVDWYNMRTHHPISKIFGMERGTPVDRFYIEDFLKNNQKYIQGVVCEISENLYSIKFGKNVLSYEIFDYDVKNTQATIIGDLCNIKNNQKDKIDCFIVTQTLNFIYEVEDAIRGIHEMLKVNGVALITVAGICQISKYDMHRWGDYWRFTDLSIKKLFEGIFGEGNVQVKTYGNLLSSIAYLQGISSEDLTAEELLFEDDTYQNVIAVIARKI